MRVLVSHCFVERAARHHRSGSVALRHKSATMPQYKTAMMPHSKVASQEWCRIFFTSNETKRRFFWSPRSGEEDGKSRHKQKCAHRSEGTSLMVVTVTSNKQLNHRSVLEEPDGSSSFPINWGWSESRNAGNEMNPRSVKMPAVMRQDRFQNTIEWEPIETKSTTNE